MASPLLQGGLEIPIKVTVTWNEPAKLSVLVAKVQAVEYPLIGEYVDDSKKFYMNLGSREMKKMEKTRTIVIANSMTKMLRYRQGQLSMKTLKCRD